MTEPTFESLIADCRRKARRIRSDAAFQDGVTRDVLHQSADELDKAADNLEQIATEHSLTK